MSTKITLVVNRSLFDLIQPPLNYFVLLTRVKYHCEVKEPVLSYRKLDHHSATISNQVDYDHFLQTFTQLPRVIYVFERMDIPSVGLSRMLPELTERDFRNSVVITGDLPDLAESVVSEFTDTVRSSYSEVEEESKLKQSVNIFQSHDFGEVSSEASDSSEWSDNSSDKSNKQNKPKKASRQSSKVTSEPSELSKKPSVFTDTVMSYNSEMEESKLQQSVNIFQPHDFGEASAEASDSSGGSDSSSDESSKPKKASKQSSEATSEPSREPKEASRQSSEAISEPKEASRQSSEATSEPSELSREPKEASRQSSEATSEPSELSREPSEAISEPCDYISTPSEVISAPIKRSSETSSEPSKVSRVLPLITSEGSPSKAVVDLFPLRSRTQRTNSGSMSRSSQSLRKSSTSSQNSNPKADVLEEKKLPEADKPLPDSLSSTCIECMAYPNGVVFLCQECEYQLCTSCIDFSRHPHVFMKQRQC
jgi:hypothetical protein